MGLFAKKEIFIPSCKPINDFKEGNAQAWECHIEKDVGGRKVQISKPVVILKEEGRPPMVYDSGGASLEDLDVLKRYLEKNML